MTTNYHTPIVTGAPANASIINTPLAQLDAAIGNNLGGGGSIVGHILTTQFDKTSDTTPEEIPDLSVDVVAGSSYLFRAMLQTTEAIGGGFNVGLYGSCSVDFLFASAVVIDGNLDAGFNSSTNTLNSMILNGSGTQNALITLEGSIVVSTSGTFYPVFCQDQSNVVTSSVLAGSFFMLTKIG